MKIPFFYDIAAHTRFLFAVPVLVLADIPIGVRLRAIMRHFAEAHLVRDKGLRKFEEIILDSLRFRDSHVGEIMVVLVTYLATYNALSGASSQSGTWFRPETGQGLTLVGYWYALVALPIFQFCCFAGFTGWRSGAGFCGRYPVLTLPLRRLTPTARADSLSSARH